MAPFKPSWTSYFLGMVTGIGLSCAVVIALFPDEPVKPSAPVNCVATPCVVGQDAKGDWFVRPQ